MKKVLRNIKRLERNPRYYTGIKDISLNSCFLKIYTETDIERNKREKKNAVYAYLYFLALSVKST